MYTKDLFNLFDDAVFGLNRNFKFQTFNGKTYEIALPGFSKEDLNIEVDGRILIISADVDEKDETRWRHSFHKRFTLPNGVDVEGIEAKLENGVLQLTFGKEVEAKKVTIL